MSDWHAAVSTWAKGGRPTDRDGLQSACEDGTFPPSPEPAELSLGKHNVTPCTGVETEGQKQGPDETRLLFLKYAADRIAGNTGNTKLTTSSVNGVATK